MHQRLVLYSFLISGVLISMLASTIIYTPAKQGMHAQANPTDNRQQTIDSAVGARFTQTAQSQAQGVATLTADAAHLQQTIDAQFDAAVTGTALFAGTKEFPLKNPCTGQPFRTVMTGAGMASAEAGIGGSGASQYVVNFVLAENDEALRFSTYTATHVGQPLAIVLDGEVLSTPIVQAALTTGGQITGNFDRDQAQRLALQIRNGALGIKLTLESMETTKTGLHLVFSTGLSNSEADAGRLKDAQRIIERRINGLGVVGAKVQIDKQRLVLDLPGVKDQDQVIKLVSQTALLEFVDFSTTWCPSGITMPTQGQYILTDNNGLLYGTPAVASTSAR